MEDKKKISRRLEKAIANRKDKIFIKKEENKKRLSADKHGKTMKSIIIVAAVMFAAFIILFIKIQIDNKDKLSSVVTESLISGQLNELNELATSKVIYDGVVEMEDNSGIFKKKFFVKYTGHVKSYVDMSKAVIKIDDRKRKISVILPHAVVGEPNIDSDYQVYDTSWLQSDSLEATTKALERAEEDCKKKIDEKTMIETADGYAKEAVENLLSSFSEIEKPYTFEVEFK